MTLISVFTVQYLNSSFEPRRKLDPPRGRSTGEHPRRDAFGFGHLVDGTRLLVEQTTVFLGPDRRRRRA